MPFDVSKTTKTHGPTTIRTLRVCEIVPDGTWQIWMVQRTDLLTVARQEAVRLFGEDAKGMAQPRDLRMLDQDLLGNSVAVLAPRLMCTIISMNELRALILCDRVYLSLPEGADGLIRRVTDRMNALRDGVQEDDNRGDVASSSSPPVVDELRTTVRRPIRVLSEVANDRYLKHELQAIPFELRALEAILSTILFDVNDEFRTKVLQDCLACLGAVQREPTGAVLEKLKQSINKANVLYVKAVSIKDALLIITQDDDMMSYMHFGSVAKHAAAAAAISHDKSRPRVMDKDAIFEVEMVLEVYLQQLGAFIKTMEDLKDELDVAESFVRLSLDVARNKFLKLTVGIMVTTSAAAVATVILGGFSMNLTSGLEDQVDIPDFWIVAGFTFFGIIITVSVFRIVLLRYEYLLS